MTSGQLAQPHKAVLDRALALIAEPDIAAAMVDAMKPKLIEVYDVPDLGGSSVRCGPAGAPLEAYIDAAVAKKKPNIAGLPYETAREGIIRHEWFENVLVRLRQIIYPDAHDMAEALENHFVDTMLGASSDKYEHDWAPLIKLTGVEDILHPPLDLACYPYWQMPDARDHKILKKLAKLGVADAYHPIASKLGARKAPDGNWYAPDPARPGKHLRFDPGG